mmetsp:Transcript_23632/g.65551  ORF Transcript_23632/g.65551 Transcript_23632/m.65551 type:complete len:299 (-) Transcript_23632:95-991(-)
MGVIGVAVRRLCISSRVAAAPAVPRGAPLRARVLVTRATSQPEPPGEGSGSTTTLESSGISGTLDLEDLGFGFSAGGMLFPYLIGVMSGLREEGVMTDRTKVAGSSAGSIVAVASASGLTADEIMEACLELAHDYRINGTRGRMGERLVLCLDRVMPDDIHERCNGVAHISQFLSREDVLNAVMTSCHIPWYFDGRFCTTFRGSPHYDGGLTNFIPVPENVASAVKVSCFPSKKLKSVQDVGLSPDSFDEDFPYSMSQLITWAFEPAEEAELVRMYERGQRNARSWAAANVPSLGSSL